LDIDSREALIMAINDYEGAVVLISHDRHIIETCVDRLWIVANGTVQPFEGDMDEYTDLVLGRSKPMRKTEKVATDAPKREKLAAPVLKKKIQELDIKIMKVKDKLVVLDQVLADPRIYVDEPKKAAEFGKLRAKFSKDLESHEDEWLALSE
jgi:ATP-binding cassette, subfamily F, member 3